MFHNILLLCHVVQASFYHCCFWPLHSSAEFIQLLPTWATRDSHPQPAGGGITSVCELAGLPHSRIHSNYISTFLLLLVIIFITPQCHFIILPEKSTNLSLSLLTALFYFICVQRETVGSHFSAKLHLFLSLRTRTCGVRGIWRRRITSSECDSVRFGLSVSNLSCQVLRPVNVSIWEASHVFVSKSVRTNMGRLTGARQHNEGSVTFSLVPVLPCDTVLHLPLHTLLIMNPHVLTF